MVRILRITMTLEESVERTVFSEVLNHIVQFSELIGQTLSEIYLKTGLSRWNV